MNSGQKLPPGDGLVINTTNGIEKVGGAANETDVTQEGEKREAVNKGGKDW